ncbi:MAG: lactonase family protein [Kiritimatiellia bacterium]|jgi:6-phosphogluconolactonase
MQTKDFYIAAMSLNPDGGIYRFGLTADGVPEQREFTPLLNASYLAFSSDRRFFYATCAVAEGTGGCAAFKLEPSGSLVFLNQMPADGPASCHLTVAPSGKFLYCANYHSSSLAEFALADDGSIAERLKIIRHTGKGPHPERQTVPHPHFTLFTPDGRYLCVVDLGLDAIMLYPFDPARGLDTTPYSVFKVTPPGSGPRHLVFNRAGDRAYLLNELGNSVVALAYSDGRFDSLQSVTSVPPHLQYPTKAAAIRLAADEKYLLVSNRGFDSIACYRVAEGALTLCDLTLSGGSSPRDINFLPGKEKFAAANEFSGNVVFFDYNRHSGKLTPNGQCVKLPRPLAICW